MHLLAEFKTFVCKSLFTKTLSLYYDRGLITESFQVSQDFVQKVNNFMPNKTNKCFKCLYEDQNSNVLAKIQTLDRSEHDIKLNFSHQPGRETVVSKIDSIINQAAEIKVHLH